MTKSVKWQRNAISAAVSAAICSMAIAPALAEDAPATLEEIIVTGVKASLTKSMDIKRNATGVVDAISSEDMGKFPDTNLAESLQRITGVSIDRNNGEGKQVTVRGFGGGFNLVTLNGRQMPAASVGTITGNSDDVGSQGTSRSFDFSQIASEGVAGVQVYKTGNAAVPTGGIGATINISTAKPLDVGNKSSVGVKAVHDGGGDKSATPEVSGLWSWANDAKTFGISAFGSYQDRDFGARGVNVSQYAFFNYSPSLSFLAGPNGIPATVDNAPAVGQLMALPANMGLSDAHITRKRTNGMITLQFAPSENTTITADAMYTQTKLKDRNLVPGIWFSRAFTYLQFDGNAAVATPIKLIEQPALPGGRGKDFFFASWGEATKDDATTFGLNLKHKFGSDWSMEADGATSTAKSGGDGPRGYNSWRMNLAAAGAGWQGAVYSGGLPTATVGVLENAGPAGGNGNGVLDIADLSTQTARTVLSTQETKNHQFNVSFAWDKGNGVSAKFGVGYMATEMNQLHSETQDFLGGWGVGCRRPFVGSTDCLSDINSAQRALIQQINVLNDFKKLNLSGYPNASGAAPAGYYLTTLGKESFYVDPYAFIQSLNGYQYIDDKTGLVTGTFNSNNLNQVAYDNNTVKEHITSAYAQSKFDGEIGGYKTQTVLGLRLEKTTLLSSAKQKTVNGFTWQSDNDYGANLSSNLQTLQQGSSYTNLLPNLDFSIDLPNALKARASVSQTIARPAYNDLFMTTQVRAWQTPSAIGGVATAQRGNPQLSPLESTNLDLSLEWYYGESDYASIGFFTKSVNNFVGTGVSTVNLFGIVDPSSGAAGTLTGQAAVALKAANSTVNEQNLFTMAAILAHPELYPNGALDYIDPGQPGGADLALAIIQQIDLNAGPNDPLAKFSFSQPINNHTSKLHGAELAWQHFFGRSGFGFQANATFVNGDVHYNNAADPSISQFALLGLSNSANAVAIYEKHGISARLAYNWRDAFLAGTVYGGVQGLPSYVAAHHQIDFNVSYDITRQLQVSLDGINVTSEGSVLYSRTKQMQLFNLEGDARYVLSARYQF
jgi:TonB-dependent receptor